MLIVMLWALIYRRAGGSAEKDLHQMDQFPLGQGKGVCFTVITAASIVLLSFFKHTRAVIWGLKKKKI